MGNVFENCVQRYEEDDGYTVKPDGIQMASQERELAITGKRLVKKLTYRHHKNRMWEAWVNDERPAVFNHLQLAQDGGFSEVKDLYFHSRWLSTIVLIFFIVYNVVCVINVDLHLIRGSPEAAEDIGIPHMDIVRDRFYLSRGLIAWMATSVLGLPEEKVPHATAVLGFLELCWLDMYFLLFAMCFVMACMSTGFRRWFHIQYIFWKLLPTLSVFSAMKLLHKVVPIVLVTDLYEKIMDLIEKVQIVGTRGGKCQLFASFAFWLFTLVISFVIGFDTFLLKLRVISGHAMKTSGNSTYLHILSKIVAPVLQFLVQAIGIVQLGPFVQKRLFVFIFGGEDGILQATEVVKMETWTALLAQRIYRDNSLLKFLAIMFSFSDDDFQSLVLNEDPETRSRKGTIPGACSVKLTAQIAHAYF